MYGEPKDTIQDQAFSDVLAERKKQDAKWEELRDEGEMDGYGWVSLISDERRRADTADSLSDLIGYRASMVKIAALAIAAVEWLDRKGAG